MAKQRNMSHLVIFDYELHGSQRFSNQNGKICKKYFASLDITVDLFHKIVVKYYCKC